MANLPSDQSSNGRYAKHTKCINWLLILSFSSKIYRNFMEWIGICFHFVFITAF